MDDSGRPTTTLADPWWDLPERWALVHLTWKAAPETPPWPKTTFYDTLRTFAKG
ncbi:hypothetical protein [Micromonospora sp. CA-246542]|uniref:hypothetical protein n=1 Tax=Micromonospora sp. CA-246542 TaxID=3239959 RepID=UPI003D8B0686